MPDGKSELGRLLDAVDRSVREQLLKHRIYDLHSYAWLDHDTPNPEFAGHHMWETNPPFEPEWGSLSWDAGPVRHRPTTRDEELVRSGFDFAGLMEMARNSIGLLLCYENSSENDLLADSPGFWLQFANGMMLLSAASERLRAFFIMAFFKKTAQKYEKRGPEFRQYCSPFDDADPTRYENTTEATVGLRPLAYEISRRRKERNEIVHKVATRLARSQLDILRHQRREFDERHSSRYESPPMASFEEIQASSLLLKTHAKQEYRTAAENVAGWYEVLVRASNFVFEIEYLIRQSLPE
jgi:hypothetical protein